MNHDDDDDDDDNDGIQQQYQDETFIEILHPLKSISQQQQQQQQQREERIIPITMDAYVITLYNPKECASLMKHLSTVLPLLTLSHLKRVQRQQQQHKPYSTNNYDVVTRQVIQQHSTVTLTNNSNTTTTTTIPTLSKKTIVSDSGTTIDDDVVTVRKAVQNHYNLDSNHKNKRLKVEKTKDNDVSTAPVSIVLKVLLGTKTEIEERFGPTIIPRNTTTTTTTDVASSSSSSNRQQYEDLSVLFTPCQYPNIVQDTIEIVPVPKGIPHNEIEWKYYNDTIWPTTYIPNQMIENRIQHEQKQLQLSLHDIEQMKHIGIQGAIQDAMKFQTYYHHHHHHNCYCHDKDHHDHTTTTTTTTSNNNNNNNITSSQQPIPIFATSDTNDYHNSGGVVIVCPKTGQILATAYDEYTIQQQQQRGEDRLPHNPLMTPYIYAIQGISRIERRNMTLESNLHKSDTTSDDVDGNLENDNISKPEIKQQQYLCTGYDVYGTIEPTIYEAMALVHSRIRRLIFGCSISDMITHNTKSNHIHKNNDDNNNNNTCVNSQFYNNDNSGILQTYVHALPSTNHHYRAFMCQPHTPLWQSCCLGKNTMN